MQERTFAQQLVTAICPAWTSPQVDKIVVSVLVSDFALDGSHDLLVSSRIILEMVKINAYDIYDFQSLQVGEAAQRYACDDDPVHRKMSNVVQKAP